MTITIDELILDTGKWADKTFPESSVFTILSHLRKEMKELAVAVDEYQIEDIAEESADVILLLCHLAYKLGISLDRATAQKLIKNKSRKWKTDSEPGGHFKHEEEGAQ